MNKTNLKKSSAVFGLLFMLAVLFVLPELALAQVSSPPSTSSTDTTLSLTPPDSDLSVGYLSNIFGNVDGVLTSSGSQLLGAMFSIFNGAVLVLGGIVILYTLFVSTLNTAHEGEMLGKRWSSMWIPLRSVMGIALLIPKTSGYSFIQIFMMWIAVMGVGAADSVWNRALDYFLDGGVLIQQNLNLSGGSNSVGNSNLVISNSTALLQSMTCLSIIQTQLTAYRNTFKDNDPAKPTPVPNLYQNTISAINNATFSAASTPPSFTVDIPTMNPGNSTDAPYADLEGACGKINVSAIQIGAGTNPTYSGVRQTAVSSMAQQLYGAGQQIANNYVNHSTNPTSGMELGHILSSTKMGGTTVNIWGAGTTTKPLPYLLSGTTISNVVNAYFGAISSALNLANTNIQNNRAAASTWVNTAKQNGWILAGSFYFNIIAMNNTLQISEPNPPTVKPLSSASLAPVGNHFGTSVGKYFNSVIVPLLNNTDGYSIGSSGNAGTFYQDVQTYASSVSNGNTSLIPPNSNGMPGTGNDKMDQMFGKVTNIKSQVGSALSNLASSQQSNQNPVVAIAQMGNGLVNTVFDVYVSVAVITFVIGMLLGLFPGFGFASAWTAFVSVFMSILTPMLVPLLVTGLTMLYYIPMIPFIIFLFGGIGWLISVVEAIMAAPLVALGIAHPEGAEILGKAEPAVGLLVNVFLRPTFMIFGFLIGMMISYVGVWILNQGVFLMFYGGGGTGTQGSVSAQADQVASSFFGPIAFLVIYVLIALQIVQKSFTLIYVIPDEVLKWIGINIKGMGGEAEAEGKIAGGYHGAAQAQGEAAAKGGEAGAGFAGAAGEADKAAMEKKGGVFAGKIGLKSFESGRKDQAG